MLKSVRPGNSRRAAFGKTGSGDVSNPEPVEYVERSRTTSGMKLVRVVKRALLKGLIGSLLFASPFLVFAAVFWSSVEARGILLYVAGCFAFGGLLAGIGLEITQTCGNKPHEPLHGNTAKELTTELAEQAIPDLIAPWWKAVKIMIWLLRKDYRAQAPGRGKRALLGAFVVGVVAIVFFGILLLAHKGFADYGMTDSLLLLLAAFFGGGAVGAVLGALSDSF